MAGSQRSSLFPWDNAGGSTSSGAFEMPGSNDLHIDAVEVRLRGSSQSHRDSSLIPSQAGSLAGGPGFSPAPIRRGSYLGEDYAFDGKAFTSIWMSPRSRSISVSGQPGSSSNT